MAAGYSVGRPSSSEGGLSVCRDGAGWVERRETHQVGGYRCAPPTLHCQIEPALLEPGGEAGAFRRHGLARLVLRPAIEIGGAEDFRGFLPVLQRVPRVAAPVVGVDGGERTVVVAVAMHG